MTGRDNKLILENLVKLAETGAAINIRIPFIKNVNTAEEEVTRMAAFIAGLPSKNYESEFAIPAKPLVSLLPYTTLQRTSTTN